MKRILMLVTVVALMVMLATAVAPAFAKHGIFVCTDPTNGNQVTIQAKNKTAWKELGYTECHPSP